VGDQKEQERVAENAQAIVCGWALLVESESLCPRIYPIHSDSVNCAAELLYPPQQLVARAFENLRRS